MCLQLWINCIPTQDTEEEQHKQPRPFKHKYIIWTWTSSYYIKRRRQREKDRKREAECAVEADGESKRKNLRWQKTQKVETWWGANTQQHSPHCHHLVRWLLSRYPCDAHRQRKQQLFTQSISGASLQWHRRGETWFILISSSSGCSTREKWQQ